MLFFGEGQLREKKRGLPSAGKGSGPSIKASLQKTKIREAVVKLRTPVWCRPKALRCLSQLRISGVSAGAWHLRRVSSFGVREGMSAFGDSRFEARYARLIMV
ncbi:unnamed protein product [Prunus brigantina]